MVRIEYHTDYFKDLTELLQKDPQIKEAVSQRFHWFVNNPDDGRLKNHLLRRKMRGKWAFSITDGIRVIYRWKGKNIAQILAIGGHEKVYR